MKNILYIYLVTKKPYIYKFYRFGVVATVLQWLRIKGHLFTQERGLLPVVRTRGGVCYVPIYFHKLLQYLCYLVDTKPKAVQFKCAQKNSLYAVKTEAYQKTNVIEFFLVLRYFHTHTHTCAHTHAHMHTRTHMAKQKLYFGKQMHRSPTLLLFLDHRRDSRKFRCLACERTKNTSHHEL